MPLVLEERIGRERHCQEVGGLQRVRFRIRDIRLSVERIRDQERRIIPRVHRLESPGVAILLDRHARVGVAEASAARHRHVGGERHQNLIGQHQLQPVGIAERAPGGPHVTVAPDLLELRAIAAHDEVRPWNGRVQAKSRRP